MILVLQSPLSHFSAITHSPRKTLPSAFSIRVLVPRREMSHRVLALVVSRLPANDLDSGQMPESRSPTTTPAPAFFWPPWRVQAPFLPESPRNSGLCQVSGFRVCDFSTSSTRRSVERRVACSALRSATKPLDAAVKSATGFAPYSRATSVWLLRSWARYDVTRADRASKEPALAAAA